MIAPRCVLGLSNNQKFFIQDMMSCARETERTLQVDGTQETFCFRIAQRIRHKCTGIVMFLCIFDM